MTNSTLHRRPEPTASPATSHLSAQSYAFLQSYILKESGIVLDESKQYLIEARLLPLIRKEGIPTLDLLCERLIKGASPSLAQVVVEAMTTNETLFFRDKAFFEALRSDILPDKLIAAKGSRKVRIWSAAASTGQEAYSIAMMLLESGADPRHVEIVATDLSEQVLDRAREGRYVQFEVSRGLPPAYLARYFVKTGTDWLLKDQVREMVRFTTLDLRGSLAVMGSCDLILCRNVLIYFNIETRRSVLTSIKQALAPEGLLALGCAETLLNVDGAFRRKVVGLATFYAT